MARAPRFDPVAVVRSYIEANHAGRRAMAKEVSAALAVAAERDPALAADLVDLVAAATKRPVWNRVARPDQIEPGTPGSASDRDDWDIWAIIAGRGAGKTRTGAEWAVEKLKVPDRRFALLAATYPAGRDDMVEGESGILSVLPPSLLRGGSVSRSWNRSLGELKLANGSMAKIYTSEKPGQLRGPQHHAGWGDELCKWADADTPITEDSTWSNFMFGLRLGRKPQALVTTTPKPVALLIGRREDPERTGLLKHPRTVVTNATTYDNLDNLAATFRTVILGWEGTRLGRQELLAEILTEIEGALWTAHTIDLDRVSPGHEVGVGGGLVRVLVAVDPSVGQGDEDHDEAGIITVGKAANGQGYVLDDHTVTMSPLGWARQAVNAYHEHSADAIIGEVNNGGDMVRAMIHVVDPLVPYEAVHASRGKLTRAEPVSALYEARRIHHVGLFPALEDQLTGWVPGDSDSPDRLDALVWGVSKLFDLGAKTGQTTTSKRNRPKSKRRR